MEDDSTAGGQPLDRRGPADEVSTGKRTVRPAIPTGGGAGPGGWV